MKKTGAYLVVVLAMGASITYGMTPSFQGLGILPDKTSQAYKWSGASTISGDGTVVAGTSGYEAFRWTSSGGLVGLGYIPGGEQQSHAYGISNNGAVVVGTGRANSPDKNLYNHMQAYRWTQAGGMQDLGDLPNASPTSEAYDVSADGSVVVGYAHGVGDSGGWRAFRWTGQTGMQDLGCLPGGAYSWARGVSGDGAVVVGYGTSPDATYDGPIAYHEAFLWTANGGMIPLGDLPGGRFASEARAISADGSVVVGVSEADGGLRAFRWTEAGGMQNLGTLGGKCCATAVSSDGSVIVGSSDSGAFIWDPTHGMRNLTSFLENDCGLDLAGWSSLNVSGISNDGLTLVGGGTNPLGEGEAWIATTPEPATLLMLGFGAMGLLSRRRAGRMDK